MKEKYQENVNPEDKENIIATSLERIVQVLNAQNKAFNAIVTDG